MSIGLMKILPTVHRSSGFCQQYKAVYDAFTTKPSGTKSKIYDLMVRQLVDGGYWARFDIFRFYANHINTAGEALLNWKQPSGGASLMDAGKGTFDSGVESWLKYGGSTVVTTEFVDGVNALKVIYIDNTNGAYTYLSAASDLNTNLTVGKTYKVWARAKVNAGSSVTLRINTGANNDFGPVIATNFTWYSGLFVATNTTTNYLMTPNMSAGEIIWIDQWFIQEWTGMTLYNAPTHTADQGILFNGTTQYGDNNWVPSVSGANFTQNSASQILYIRTNITIVGGHGTGANADAKDVYLNPLTTPNASIRINDGTAFSGANTNGSGLYINTRTAAAVKKLYRNGTAIINGTTASTGVPTHSPYTGAYNDDNVAAGFRADEIGLEAWGNGLSQEDVTAITNIIESAFDALGTGVIS